MVAEQLSSPAGEAPGLVVAIQSVVEDDSPPNIASCAAKPAAGSPTAPVLPSANDAAWEAATKAIWERIRPKKPDVLAGYFACGKAGLALLGGESLDMSSKGVTARAGCLVVATFMEERARGGIVQRHLYGYCDAEGQPPSVLRGPGQLEVPASGRSFATPNGAQATLLWAHVFPRTPLESLPPLPGKVPQKSSANQRAGGADGSFRPLTKAQAIEAFAMERSKAVPDRSER